MGIIFMATADLQSKTMWSDTGTNATVSSDTARTGNYSFKLLANAYMLHTLATPTIGSIYTRIGFRFPTGSTMGTLTLAYRNGTTVLANVVVDPTAGTLTFRRDTTTLYTVSGLTLTADVWHCLEFRGFISATNGTTGYKLNGSAAATVGGQDTGNVEIDNVRISAAVGTVYIDDVVIRDDAYPGQGGLYVTTPNAYVASTVFASSTGSALHTAVDELPVSEDDYIYADAENNSALAVFGHTGIPDLSYKVVSGIGVFANAKLSASGVGYLNTLYSDPDVAGESGSALALSTTGQWVASYWDVDSADEAWTRAKVNRSYIGVQVSAIP